MTKNSDILTIFQATGESLGTVMMGLGSIGVGLVIAIVFSWKLTLVIFVFIPVVMLSGIFRIKVLTGFTVAMKGGFLEAGKVS